MVQTNVSIRFSFGVTLFSLTIGFCISALTSCKSTGSSRLRETGGAGEAMSPSDACSAVATVRQLVGCINAVGGERAPSISQILTHLPSGRLRCTTSERSAQPGSPTNPRCFLEITNNDQTTLMPSWTLNEDRIEVGQTIVGDKVGNRAGQIMADIEFENWPVSVDQAFARALKGVGSIDPCAHCHRLYRRVGTTAQLGEYKVRGVIQPGEQILDAIEGQPVHATIRIDGDADENTANEEIPALQLKDRLVKLLENCSQSKTPERCLRLSAMLELMARNG